VIGQDHTTSAPTAKRAAKRAAKRKKEEEMKEGGKNTSFLFSNDMRRTIPKGWARVGGYPEVPRPLWEPAWGKLVGMQKSDWDVSLESHIITRHPIPANCHKRRKEEGNQREWNCLAGRLVGPRG